MSSSVLIPSTRSQRRMHVHHLLHPEDAGLNLAYLFRFTGRVDADRLRDALEKVARGVPAFNVTFHELNGVSYLGRHPEDRYEVPLSVLPPGGEGELRRTLAEQADTPLPPDRWPLYKLAVYRGSDAVYVSFLMSHLIADAQTFHNFDDELQRVYADPTLPPGVDVDADPVTTASAPRSGDGALEHFRLKLAGLTHLAMPELEAFGAPGRPVLGARSSTLSDSALASGLEEVLATRNYRRFPFLLSTYLVVLARLTNQTQVITGVPIGDRLTPQQRRAFGYFVNTLPLTVDLADHTTFDSLYQAVKREVTMLMAHRTFDSSTNLDEASSALPAMHSAPNNAFTYYPEPLLLHLPGCRVDRLPLERRHVTYPLCIQVEDQADGFTVHAEYADALRPARPADCFTRVLRTVIEKPTIPLHELHLLDDAEQERIDALLGKRTTYRTPPSLATWFEGIAAARPDHHAAEGDGVRYSYAALNGLANMLARRLEREVKGDFVGVAMRRRPELIAILLACLKAGKAYVPLDPQGPRSRLSHIREQFDRQSGGLPIVTEDGLLPDVTGADRLDFTALHDRATAESDADVPRPDDRNRTAYVIFTSGSTGRPKGVQVSHHNVMRLFRAAERQFVFGVGDTWCLFHSYAFDFSVWEMYGALLYGGRLVIVPEEIRRSPADFAEFLCAHEVTVLNQTPSAFRHLVSVLNADHATRLRLKHVIFGGEELRFDILRPWFALMGERTTMVNMYGITETTVHVTYQRVTPEMAHEQTASLIGRPLDDLRARIVDDGLRPVPLGIPGELLVGGDGVAQGYLGAPELTAARFRPDLIQGEVLYRTGDRVLAEESGRLVYLGRIDRQVQLRGYRVELGEIESALRRVPGVRDCLVRVDPRDPASPRLAAYLVEERPLRDGTVREQIRELLPAYMIPSFLVRVPSLPITLNGKVDETALPSLPQPVSTSQPDGADGTIECVARIWREAIQSAEFGLDDNFFDVGGTSLHVVQVHRRLQEAFELPHLRPVDLFEHTTVRQLAAHIERRLARSETAQR
ncbi:amino acid adenylation domain-containing protein [Streptomyces arenae]|nr:amino acid adenylation domain-containing protein [Streptomyces arenae]